MLWVYHIPFNVIALVAKTVLSIFNLAVNVSVPSLTADTSPELLTATILELLEVNIRLNPGLSVN
jgi:hypothetical protein